MILKLFAPTKELRRKFITKQKSFQCIGLRKFQGKYKGNAVTGELYRAKRIASNFDDDTKRIRSKYTDEGYPKHVIENTFKNLNREKDELLIRLWLFNDRKHITIRLLFSSNNEKYCAHFISKLVSFASGKVKFNVV